MTVLVNMPLADEDARRAIVADLDHTLIVEAAAGTGKTTELVNRILAVVERGPETMPTIVAVTFTEKAAGELKLRLRECLEQRRLVARDGAVVERLEHALATLEEAHVNTIHGFCADLLRERPVEARVDPLFAVLSEDQSRALYDRAFGRWLQEALQASSPGVRRALRRTSAPSFRGSNPEGPVDRLRSAGWALAEWRAFPALWRRPPFDRDGAIVRLIGQLHQLAALSACASYTGDNLYRDLDAVRRLSHQIALEQQFKEPDLDGWEARLVDLVRDRGFSKTRKGSGARYGTMKDAHDGRAAGSQITRTEVLAARDALFGDLQLFKRDADADLAAALQQELRPATVAYEALKDASGSLDYNDLLMRTRELLIGNPEVRQHLQQSIARIFVDEFQDTDPVQADILLLLAADDPQETDPSRVRPRPGKLFIVGDPKQAIYRFRGTDVATYWRVKHQLARCGGRVLPLTTNYRSLPGIQRFVNRAFREQMTENPATLQPGYVPLSELRRQITDQPTVVALPVPRPYGTSSWGPLRASGKAIDDSLPDAVGAYIEWLIDPANGWTVSEPGPDGEERQESIKPRHIAVLFRRFTSFGQDVTRPYTDAIEARGIPHLLVGGKSFHGREEVETMRAALAAIEWPDDELSLFATLKGSLFAIDDEHLLEFRSRFGTLHPFRIPRALGGNSGAELELAAEPTSHLMPIADALRVLQMLHRGRNLRPVADTITRLLEATRAHVGFILRPGGEQALANVLHVAELARQYEARGGISFRGFIDELREAAESEGAEAPILEESSDGVRLMTVHKAKGLEFPVVILADMTCRLARNDASQYVSIDERLCALRIGGWSPHELHDHEEEEVLREKAEAVRLAYVAATRARDLLVVPALGDGPWEDGWFSPLNGALYPPASSRRSAPRGPMCPAFRSKDTVLARPDDTPALETTVAPGLHPFDADGYAVVWWEPGRGGGLTTDRKPPFGVRRDDLIVKDVPRRVVADGRSLYDQWRLARADARAAGRVASVSVTTAREWARTEPTGADGQPPSGADIFVDSVRVVSAVPEDAARRGSGGPAFGLLVHELLAQLPLTADRTRIAITAGQQARIIGLPDDIAASAVDTVVRVLEHDVMARAREAEQRGECRRETPVAYPLGHGLLVEGVVDLAFRNGDGWDVIDFKTDREMSDAGEEQYRRQVAVYCAAISKATGLPARGTILRI
jgi:ATP-dependent exoDNAse (exonuclease V) beta subunit